MYPTGHHVQIGNVLYRLREDAEGNHYVVTAEPLRPPNAVTVQGESSGQNFQVRPDLLLWSITDWSGGEGQIKFDDQAPNRMRELTGVRVFEQPGTLRPGYDWVETSYNSATLEKNLVLVVGDSRLYGLSTDDDFVFVWNESTEVWDKLHGDSATAWNKANPGRADGDSDYIYAIRNNADDVFKFQSTSGFTFTNISDGLITASTTSTVVQLGEYVYIYDPVLAVVNEVPKTGSAGSTIDSWTEEGTALPSGCPMTTANGKVYILVVTSGQTVIREITPTSAATVGFGAEVARLHGFVAHGIWSHSGLLWMVGDFGVEESLAIMYFNPRDLTYGTIGRLREGQVLGDKAISEDAGTALEHAFAVKQVSASLTKAGIVQIDSVSGGTCFVAVDYTTSLSGQDIGSIAQYKGDYFISTGGGATTKRVVRVKRGAYTTGAGTTSYATTPWHDFNIADEKNLNSIVLTCEPLPADWTIYVDYAVDGSNTWTTAITYTTDNGTGTKEFISTFGTTKTFHTLSVRVRFSCSASNPTTKPVVLGLDVLAAVVLKQKVWRLTLDLGDDTVAGVQRLGSEKVDNLITLGDSGEVIDFRDGYWTRQSGTQDVGYHRYRAYIDGYDIDLNRPGEGVAHVVLKEVV